MYFIPFEKFSSKNRIDFSLLLNLLILFYVDLGSFTSSVPNLLLGSSKAKSFFNLQIFN